MYLLSNLDHVAHPSDPVSSSGETGEVLPFSA